MISHQRLPPIVLIFTLFTITFYSSSGQGLDDLKLADAEIPEEYKATDKMLYKSVQAATFYTQSDLYESFIGKIRKKAFQSYESKHDAGGIYYYEFEDDFEHQGFLEALLWGGKKPTKHHPEEYFVSDNILVIWSLAGKSKLKKVSRDKIMAVLK